MHRFTRGVVELAQVIEMAQVQGEAVFTVPEVAKALRMSDETIRRKIDAGELNAMTVTSSPRKSYRVLYRHLVEWLGESNAQAVFASQSPIDEFRQLFAHMTDEEREILVTEAVAWARMQQPERKLTGEEVTAEEIRVRFGE
jgi:excisionase family DNA binding protein